MKRKRVYFAGQASRFALFLQMTAMVANYYIYCHFVGERLKDMGITSNQWNEMHDIHAKCIEQLWDGVGQWRA